MPPQQHVRWSARVLRAGPDDAPVRSDLLLTLMLRRTQSTTWQGEHTLLQRHQLQQSISAAAPPKQPCTPCPNRTASCPLEIALYPATCWQVSRACKCCFQARGTSIAPANLAAASAVGVSMEIRLMAILCVAVFGVAAAQPAPPEPCGTLDLSSPSTQHCFPADGEWLNPPDWIAARKGRPDMRLSSSPRQVGWSACCQTAAHDGAPLHMGAVGLCQLNAATEPKHNIAFTYSACPCCPNLLCYSWLWLLSAWKQRWTRCAFRGSILQGLSISLQFEGSFWNRSQNSQNIYTRAAVNWDMRCGRVAPLRMLR